MQQDGADRHIVARSTASPRDRNHPEAVDAYAPIGRVCAALGGVVLRCTICAFGEGLSGESDDLDEVVEGGEIIGVPAVERKVRGACSGRDQKIDCSRSAGLSPGRNDR